VSPDWKLRESRFATADLGCLLETERPAKLRPGRTKLAIRRKRRYSGLETEVFERQARICKAFANATRLQILDFLGKRDWAAADLQAELGISKANLSQHVAILKATGIVGTLRKDGRTYCSLLMPEVKSACHLLRGVLRAQVRNGRRLSI
jgi:DNA-binding transcriptional ArsR family regulator